MARKMSRAAVAPETLTRYASDNAVLYCGDSAEVMRDLPANSVHLSIYSPPFANLYIYSNSERDLGNSANDAEFFAHYAYIIREMHRLTIPGRLSAVHCKQLVNYKGRDGMAGLRDFRGEIIRAHVEAGWAYHSEVTIWTDPVLEMQRTKAHGLLYKQLRADSSFSRQGLAEYLVVFRKWPQGEAEEALVETVAHERDQFPLDQWQQDASCVWRTYADPVWMDIRRTNVLNTQLARDDKDSKHLCPLQLDVIERAINLWSNPGDTIFTPFLGVGSEIFQAVKQGRRGVGIELKPSYCQSACGFVQQAEQEKARRGLFDTLPVADAVEAVS